MYTPTTKLDHYVGYLKALHKAIVNGRQWRYRWPAPPGDEAAVELLESLMQQLRALGDGHDNASAEDALVDLHRAWCKAERTARAKARAEQAEEEYTATGGGAFREKEHAVEEISYRYFGDACASTLALASAKPTTTDATVGKAFDPTSMVFRRLDRDGNGTISIADLKAAVLNDAPSAWFMHLPEANSATGKPSKRRASLRVIAKLSKGLGGGHAAPAPTRTAADAVPKGAGANTKGASANNVSAKVGGAGARSGSSKKVHPHVERG